MNRIIIRYFLIRHLVIVGIVVFLSTKTFAQTGNISPDGHFLQFSICGGQFNDDYASDNTKKAKDIITSEGYNYEEDTKYNGDSYFNISIGYRYFKNQWGGGLLTGLWGISGSRVQYQKDNNPKTRDTYNPGIFWFPLLATPYYRFYLTENLNFKVGAGPDIHFFWAGDWLYLNDSSEYVVTRDVGYGVHGTAELSYLFEMANSTYSFDLGYRHHMIWVSHVKMPGFFVYLGFSIGLK